MKKLLWLMVFTLYVLTAARTMTGFGDSDELIASGYTLSVPHPPGYPILVGLIYLATHVPLLSPLAGANVLAAAIMASVMLMVYVVSLMFLNQKQNRWAWLAVLGVATTGLVWEHGTVIEVFGLNVLFSLILLWFTVKITGSGNRMQHHPFFLAGWAAAAGLGMAHHQTFVLVLLPMAAFLGYTAFTFSNNKRLFITLPLLSGIFFIIGYSLLGWIGLKNSPYSWQFSPTLEGLWRFYRRADYSGYSPELGMLSAWWSGVSLDKTLEAWGFFIQEMGRHWGLLLPVGIVGIATARKRLGPWFWLLLATWVLSGPVLAGYLTLPDAIPRGIDYETSRAIVNRMYVLSDVWWGLWTVMGLVWFAGYLQKRGKKINRKLEKATWILGLILLMTVTAIRYPHFDLSHYKTMEHYMRDILEPLPRDSRLICMSDITCFGATYSQTLLNIRPDIEVVSTAPQLRGDRIKTASLARFWYPDNPFRLGEIIGWSTITNKPVFISQLNNYWTVELGLNTESFWLVPAGYVMGVSRLPPQLTQTISYSYSQPWQEKLSGTHRFAAVLKAVITEQHALNTNLLSRMDRYEEAKEELSRGLRLDPENKILRQMENTISQTPPDPRYQMAVDEDSYLHTSRQCRHEGDLACELKFAQWAVWRRPEHAESRLNLAQAMEAAQVEPLAKREYKHVLELDPENQGAIDSLKRLEQVEDLGDELR